MKSKKRLKSKITKLLLVIPLVALMLLILNVSGALAYFTDRISLANIFTVKDSHTVTYRYYEVDENNNITTLQASKSKVYFDGSRITLGEDSEYFINNSNKYESITYKIGSTQIQNTYTTTNSNVTIDQYYQLKRYTVSYNLDGGTLTTANPTVYTEKTETFTLNNPTKNGYTFTGWRSNEKNLFNEEEILMKIEGATHSGGYYNFHPKSGDAAYGRITDTIDSNVGTETMDITYKENTQYTLSIKGYTDYIEDAGVYQTYFIGFFYTDGTSDNVTLYGDERERILVSPSGKTVSRIAMSYGRAHEGANVHIKYIQLEEGNAATEYEPYAVNPVTITKGSTGDKSYKAVWSINSYTLTVNPSGGTWNSSSSNSEITQDYNTTLSVPVPTREGYTFNGWTNAGSGSITSNTPVATTTQGYTYGAGNATLTANWTANTYTVTADANGGTIPTTIGWTGTGNTSTKQVTYDSAYGQLPEPTREGYIFKGWNGKNLYNCNIYTNAYIESSSSVMWSNDNYLSNYIPVSALKTYTISANQMLVNIGVAYYDSNKQFISRGDNYNISSLTITPTNTGYVRFWINVDRTTKLTPEIALNYEVQFEEASIRTIYEPYYITSSTEVVQPNDHTLTAMWLKIAPENCNGDDIVCINNYSDLVRLRDEVNAGDNKAGKYYFLTSDIDMGGLFDNDGNMLTGSTNWVSIGNTNNTPFSGTFDGNGHIIENLYINTSNRFNSLFGYVTDGTIKNLGIEDSFIINNSYGSASIIGYMYNSKLDSCYSKANVIGQKTTAGLVEYMIGLSYISNCYNSGTVNNSGNQFAGGIAGYKETNSIIKNCYNSGNILGGNEIAGIIGGQKGEVSNVYNVGTISGSGITGQLYQNGVVKNAYNVGTVSCGGIIHNIISNLNQQLINNYYLNTTASYGIWYSSNDNFESKSNNNTTPLTASEMPSVISVINGDNAFVEDTNNINNGYPILKWEANR